jgi:hypothetical protein
MATLDLGDLGKEPKEPAEQDDFPWFGQTVRISPGATDLALIDFVEAAGHLDENDIAAGGAVKDFIRGLIDPEDFDMFWKLARTNGLGFEDIANVSHRIIEQVTSRPTGQSSDSSAGLTVIGKSSTDDSYSEVQGRLERSGRADLSLVYEYAKEAGVAS